MEGAETKVLADDQEVANYMIDLGEMLEQVGVSVWSYNQCSKYTCAITVVLKLVYVKLLISWSFPRVTIFTGFVAHVSLHDSQHLLAQMYTCQNKIAIRSVDNGFHLFSR